MLHKKKKFEWKEKFEKKIDFHWIVSLSLYNNFCWLAARRGYNVDVGSGGECGLSFLLFVVSIFYVLVRARWLGDEWLCVCCFNSSTPDDDSPTSAALCRHAGIIFENDIAIVVKVKERQRWEDVGDTTRSRDFWMTADCVHDTLDSCVIRWIQLLIKVNRTNKQKQTH